MIFMNCSNVTSLRKMNVVVKLAIDKREKDELFKGGTRKRWVKYYEPPYEVLSISFC